MSEIPEPIRRAMEAQARRTGRIDVAAVEAALEAGDPIPPDKDDVRALRWRDDMPVEAIKSEEHERQEQAALFGEERVPISYETLIAPADVAAYKRVKAATMRIAEDVREIAARLVNGTIGDADRSGKQFILTGKGLFRLATSERSDNSTEVAAHERMGVTTIHLSDPDEMIRWFALHGLDGGIAYDRLVRDLRARYRT